MKLSFPHNILLAMAAVSVGAVLFYNTFLQKAHMTVLRYEYPVIEESQQSDFQPENDGSWQPILDDEEWEESENLQEDAALASVDFPLDINLATEQQLKFIPRVGDTMSQRIVQYREHLGGYTSLEQLMEIKGIGENVYNHLSQYLIIDPNITIDSASQNEDTLPEGIE